MRELNITRWLSLIIGILLLVSGGLSLLNPVAVTVTIVQFISLMLIAIGLLKLFRYFSNSLFKSVSFLISGIIDVVVGFLMLKNLTVSIGVFRLLVGFWILLGGITEIATAIDLKNMQLKRWWLGIISGILGLVIGFAIVANVEYFVIYTSIFLSFYMLVLGINFISTFIGLTNLKNNF